MPYTGERNLSITSNTFRSCQYCTMFRTVRTNRPHDDGECAEYGDDVRGDFTCASFSSGEDEKDQSQT